MKNILRLTLIVAMITGLGAEISFAQEKTTRKEKNELRRIAANKNFTEIIQTANFRFTVFGIETELAPMLAGTQLDGGFFVSVENEEMTVLLPVGGPNAEEGNASSMMEQLSYTAGIYQIVVSPTESGGQSASIKSKDPRLNTSCTFVLTIENESTTLSVYVSGMDTVVYTGSLIRL